MFYTEIGLTQYEMHDPVSFLDRYNTDMQIITTTATVAAGRVDLVEQESKDRDEELQDNIDTNHNDIVNNANDISELKAKDTELEGRIDLNAQDIAALQVTTTSISAQLLSHIETSTSFAAGVMQKVEDNYTELKTDIMADRERISVAEVAISNIQQGDTEIAQKVATLEADNTQNKNAIAALEQVDQTQGESIQDLRGKMTTAESNILANSNDITSLDGRMETAEQNIEDLQEQTVTIKTDNYKLNNEITVHYFNGNNGSGAEQFNATIGNLNGSAESTIILATDTKEISIAAITFSRLYQNAPDGVTPNQSDISIRLTIPDGYIIPISINSLNANYRQNIKKDSNNWIISQSGAGIPDDYDIYATANILIIKTKQTG